MTDEQKIAVFQPLLDKFETEEVRLYCVVLPEPENEMEKLIHMCDYLSSRSNIDMQPPEYLKGIFDDIKSDIEFDEEYTINFGKHKGEKLLDVYRSKPDYIAWCEENLVQRRDLIIMIQAMKEWLKEKENTKA